LIEGFRTTARRALILALLACLLPATVSAGTKVAGRVEISLPGMTLAQLGPVVVYLDGIDGQIPFEPGAGRVTIRQKNAAFSPSFSIVAPGQTVDMPNIDAIYHNVFSFSRPNDFDLGIYPAGESRSLEFEHPGVVRMYCSIHESMNATIFVSPSPFYDRAGVTGTFEIEGVPDGRYLLRTWNEKLPPTVRQLTVEAGKVETLKIDLADMDF
jgi:plastocyanin